MMKVVLPGGSGQIGAMLARHFAARGADVVVLGRGAACPAGARLVAWDGTRDGAWGAELDGADLVVNLAGRTVNCRYTPSNLAEMLASRVDSTAAVGRAIAAARHPPPVWLQMSTATIYAHRFDAANDEATGVIGGGEPGAPAYWAQSVRIAQAWEAALAAARTPATRKVALRAAMVMSPDAGGVFDVLSKMTRWGLGGAIAGGRQYVSWIHERDLIAAIEHLAASRLAGAVNLCAPDPRPQRDFQAALRRAWGQPVGLPAAAWMAGIGAFVLRTDTELLLKSRRVVPGRLLADGFRFAFPAWPAAAEELVSRARPPL